MLPGGRLVTEARRDAALPPPGSAAVWLLAARPRTLAASVAPVLIGTAMAFGAGALHAPAALAALVCAVLIQVATNLANDLLDFEKGADTEARLGPMRVTQAGLASPGAMRRAVVAVLALAFLCGLYLVWRGGWPILTIGLVSVAAGLLYTGGPRPLGYIGLGDLLVLVFFGPVAVAGTYYVQALSVSPTVIVAGLGPGLISVAMLAVNNLRDTDEDRRAGKKTLAVRFGPGFARGEYVAAVGAACALPLALHLATGRHPWSVAACLTVLAAAPAFRRLLACEGAALNPVLARTAGLLVVYSVLFSAGWVL